MPSSNETAPSEPEPTTTLQPIKFGTGRLFWAWLLGVSSSHHCNKCLNLCQALLFAKIKRTSELANWLVSIGLSMSSKKKKNIHALTIFLSTRMFYSLPGESQFTQPACRASPMIGIRMTCSLKEDPTTGIQ
jgi:hypothetical protein